VQGPVPDRSSSSTLYGPERSTKGRSLPSVVKKRRKKMRKKKHKKLLKKTRWARRQK
jgi:hypothetical protein